MRGGTGKKGDGVSGRGESGRSQQGDGLELGFKEELSGQRTAGLGEVLS